MEQPFRFGFVNDHSSESEDSEKELSISKPVTQVDAVNIRVEVPKLHTFQQMV